jgi:hypothetical protein
MTYSCSKPFVMTVSVKNGKNEIFLIARVAMKSLLVDTGALIFVKCTTIMIAELVVITGL